MRRSKWLLLVILLFLVVVRLIWQQPDGPVETNSIRIAMIPKVMGINYFDQCAAGAKAAAVPYNMDILYKGPTTADAASQVNIVQEMIYLGVDVIAIAPVDPYAVKPVLDLAREKGILVISFDADTVRESRDVFVNQVSAEVLGQRLIENLVDLIGPKGRYAVITASLTADNQNTWIQAMDRYRDAYYPELICLTVIPTDEDRQKAYAVTRDLLQAYPEIDGIIAMSTEAGPGAAQAFNAMAINGRVKLYTLAMPNDMRPYLKSNAMQLVTLWNPYELGQLTVEIIQSMLMGEPIQDGGYYGAIGPIQYIESTGVVIMGQPLDFDADNVDAYDF